MSFQPIRSESSPIPISATPLKRINGINVQYDQGEARFGQVRGTSADLSSVTINGNRLPSAEGDTRNVQLDLIPADMVQTIEVKQGRHLGYGRRCHRRLHQSGDEKHSLQTDRSAPQQEPATTGSARKPS